MLSASSRGLVGLSSSGKNSNLLKHFGGARDMSVFSRIKVWHDKRHKLLRHDYDEDVNKIAVQKAYEAYQERKGPVEIDSFYNQTRVSESDLAGPLASHTNSRKSSTQQIQTAPGGMMYKHIKGTGDFSEEAKIAALEKYNNIINQNKSLTLEEKRARITPDSVAYLNSLSIPDPVALRREALGKRPKKNSGLSLWSRIKGEDARQVALDAVAASSGVAPVSRRRKTNQFTETLLQHYKLTKPNISLMVMTTAWWGYGLSIGSFANFSALDFSVLSVGTLAMAISASIINQIREVDVDAKMTRTAARPLVTGKISIPTAKALSVIYGAGGAAVLATISPIAAALGLFNIALYGGLYTSLKRKSALNTEVGAVVGMIPPVMGYFAGVPEGLPLLHDPMALFWPAAFMLAWQVQHVMLICLRRSEDYNRSGLVMQCLNDPDLQTTRAKGVAWSATTTLVAAIPLIYGWSEISQVMVVYMWGAYTAMYATGAFAKKPRQELLKVCLYLGYLFMFITIAFSFISRKVEEDFQGIQLNKKKNSNVRPLVEL